MKTKLMAAVALGLLTAACGTTTEERTTGGAAAGAATGAAVGALGGPPGVLAGAAIGAGAGAVTGATTSPQTLNLGEPPWSNPEARVPGVDMNGSRSSRVAMQSDPRVRNLQQALNDRGYSAGPVDGIWGPQTRAGVREWQRANNMPVTGRPSDQMLSDLNVSGGSSMARGSGSMSNDRATGGNMNNMGTGAGGSGMSGPTGMPGNTGQSGSGAMGSNRAVDQNPTTPPPGGGSQTNPFVNQNTNRQ